ncbi:PQQ-dependent sugar dehydrogenase [Qipengyuania sediminis]|uniref:PQQ-dependent sugar dehydrogenase n=1 Tax=Qipengyuania sediminis TaxID=1532023 RepID=UPI00105A44AA|nr:PQQ-dependent sugar dehydrogenase [Qipengyuania sediminis]
MSLRQSNPRQFRAVAGALSLLLALSVASCGEGGEERPPLVVAPSPTPIPAPTASNSPPPVVAVQSQAIATLQSPWAMVFLPDGRLLVTESDGRLRAVTTTGTVGPAIAGVPAVDPAGQGGLLDVALDPAYATNARIYLSYSERDASGSGLAVARGRLQLAADGSGSLSGVEVIWRQRPKISNDDRHFGGRLAFAPDGLLLITAGERHQGAPAQDRGTTLGKIIRIRADGTIPADNPFVGVAGTLPEIWTLGHRNPYGLVFATDGRLFESEMGPSGGDEFNLVTRGANYGWRIVSEGNDGEVLPRHSTRPDFAAPLVSWTPVIAPGGMIQYTGTLFTGWTGDFVLAGLVSQGLVRVRVTGNSASEVGRIGLGRRIREVEQGPDGAIWALEDGANARLLRLIPQ